MTMPNFLMIGAAKSGTTTLYNYLKRHPQVYMSEPKEPYFFATEGEEINFHGPGDNDYAHREIVNNLKDYQALFDGVTDEIAIGEASAFYLYSKRAADNIKRYIPDVKLIVVLRNPVDRAYSSYKHMMRDMREKEATFEDALVAETKRIQAGWYPIWHYTQAGFYFENLNYYFQHFSPDNIQVYLNEDLRDDPARVASQVFDYLGVDLAYEADTFNNYNVSYIPKNKALQNARKFLLTPNNPVKEFLKPLLPRALRQQMGQAATNFIDRVNVKDESISTETRQALIDVFASDIEQLQDLINRDLSHWLTVKENRSSS
ncbi:MAG: sulfotransferase [Chloroflexota bacterium]